MTEYLCHNPTLRPIDTKERKKFQNKIHTLKTKSFTKNTIYGLNFVNNRDLKKKKTSCILGRES